ncbi:MAG: TolC family protein [Calditrichaeota bacterium]|nr:MAG: TolC family protein [Calditrichota bacterium]
MRLREFGFGILLILTSCTLAGEYTLEQILALAEANNHNIRLAEAETRLASAEKLAAFSRAMPRLSVDAGYNRNFQENVFFFEARDPFTGEEQRGSFKVSFRNEYRLNAVLNQTLFSFEVGQAIQAARYLSRLTEFSYEATRQQVFTVVKKAFYRALLLQQVAEVARESEVSARENYEKVKLWYEQGLASEFDLLQAETRWQNAIPEAMKARRDYELAVNNLKVLVGLPMEEEIVLTGNIDVYPPLPDSVGFQEVLAQRPDYNALIWEKKLRQKNVSARRAGFFPSLKATLSYVYSAASDAFRLERENDNIVLGLSLSVPIFNANTIAQVHKAQVEVEKTATRIDQAGVQIQVELQNIYLRLREARQRIEAARQSVLTARRAYEIARAQVENQLATQVELKESRVALDQAQINYYSAIFDYLVAYFDWQLATGNVSAGGL